MDLAEARELDFRAKDIESTLRNSLSSLEDEEGRDTAIKLRLKAGTFFESNRLFLEAGFSWSKAARGTYLLGRLEESLNYRIKAISCFERVKVEGKDRAGKACAWDLAMYGERMIKKGLSKEGYERYFFIGIGMNATEEAMMRFKKYELRPIKSIKYAFDERDRAVEVLEDEGLKVNMSDGYSIITR